MGIALHLVAAVIWAFALIFFATAGQKIDGDRDAASTAAWIGLTLAACAFALQVVA